MARHRDGGLLLGLALSMTLLGPPPGRAEVATDGTLGAKVRLTGKEVTIPARLGQRRGKNLFHSFERFGVEAGQTVTFTAPERLKLKNVIGRVTGGKRSTIDGTLASKIKGADLWLLNPAGILFGPTLASPIRQAAMVRTGTGPSFIQPRQLDSVEANWLAEVEPAPESTMTFGQVEIAAHRLAAYVEVSNVLLEDSAIDLDALLATDFADQSTSPINSRGPRGRRSPPATGRASLAGC